MGNDSNGFAFTLPFDKWVEITLPTTTDAVSIPKLQDPGKHVVLQDITGTETKLLDFGILYNPYAENKLEMAERDMLILEDGAGSKKVPWNRIEIATLQESGDWNVKLKDGEMLDHVKLRWGKLIGTEESGFTFVLPITDCKSISFLSIDGYSGSAVQSGNPNEEIRANGDSQNNISSPAGIISDTDTPVIALMVEDSTGAKTVLTEFGVVAPGSYEQLEHASRDHFGISLGQGIKAIPWGTIKSVHIQSPENATIRLSDDKILKNVNPTTYCLVGKDENEFHFVFDFKNQLTITPLRDTSEPAIEELVRDIPSFPGGLTDQLIKMR